MEFKKCLICENETRGKYCSSNCWNKGNKKKTQKADKKYYENNKEKLKQKMLKWGGENPLKWKERQRKKHYNEQHNNKIKWLARSHDHLKRDKKCCKFKNIQNLEFHHTNYIKKEGFTLCVSCHRDLHKLEVSK